MLSRFKKLLRQVLDSKAPLRPLPHRELDASIPLIVDPQGNNMFDTWRAQGRAMSEQEDARRYFLTDEQVIWFDRHLFLGGRAASLTEVDSLWHGFHRKKPVLNNDQALWLSRTKQAAENYRDWGCSGEKGVIHFRPSGEIRLAESSIGVTEFFRDFDEGWGLNHDHFSRRLHAWAMIRELPGIFDSVGDVVIFRAADLIKEVC